MENFAHGVSRVDVVAGMVRLEMFTLEPPAAEGEAAKQVITQAVVMPMEGFLRAFAAQENLVQQLVTAGVLARRDEAAPAAPVTLPSSPNFA